MEKQREMSIVTNEEIPVLVTTAHRGVFFGYLATDADKSARSLSLVRVRNAIYWAGRKGFLGLAQDGPEDESRVGREAAGPILFHDVTSVAVCSPEAAKKWSEFK